jgi:hypothetical protein
MSYATKNSIESGSNDVIIAVAVVIEKILKTTWLVWLHEQLSLSIPDDPLAQS